jgi:hypothetical protein
VGGYEVFKPGWVRLDTYFTFEKYDLDYIINAIRLITLHAEKFLIIYQADFDGNFKLRSDIY